MFELLAFAGEWERAGQQLAVLAQETSEKGWGATVYQNLLLAEQTRRKVFAGQAKPDIFLDPPPFIATRWEAVEHLAARHGRSDGSGHQKAARIGRRGGERAAGR